LGGGGGIRTRVLNTSSLKELQQYGIYCKHIGPKVKYFGK